MRTVSEAKAVSSIVYMAGEPFRIPDRVMDTLMARAGEDGLVVYRDETDDRRKERLAKGTKVRFAPMTPFEGLIAEVAADLGKSIRVVGEMFMGGCEISVDPAHLEVVA